MPKIKFLKSRKKPTLSDVLNFASLILKFIFELKVYQGISLKVFREAKFKTSLRVGFLTHFTKNFWHFLTPKVKSGTDI